MEYLQMQTLVQKIGVVFLYDVYFLYIPCILRFQ